MRRIEAEILFRPHYLGELKSAPRGKTNQQIYNDAKAKAEKLETLTGELMAKIQLLSVEIKELEPEKENETPKRKGSKSPKEKYLELLQKQAGLIEKKEGVLFELEEAKKALEVAEQKKDKITLSETAKKRLRTIAIEIKYKRRKRLLNKYVRKGLLKEDEGAEIYGEFLGESLVIEKERKKSDYFTGETDLRKYNKAGEVIEIIDIKNRYDLDTLEDRRGEEMDSDNAAQLLGYLDLYPTAKRLKIANVLCDNDFTLINDEIRAEVYRTKPEELTATGELKAVRIIEIARENIYSRERFLEFLSLHIEAAELFLLKRGESDNVEAQNAFNDFIELEIEERVIEQVEQVTPEHFEELERTKKILDACREYLADVYNIHHVKLGK